MPETPPVVAAALDRLKDELGRTAGANFAGLIMYGGLARGRYRPGKSDVNVVLLLRDASAQALTAIAPALRTARRSANVVPLILTPAEIGPAALVFPTKFLDIKDHHVVLAGEDPFASLDVPREQVRWRIVQELRNLTMRLRHRFTVAVGDPDALTASLVGVVRPLAIELAAMLRLAGKNAPAEDRSAAVFQAASAAFDADADALAQIAALRQGEPIRDEPATLYGKVLATLGKLCDQAERLQEAPR